MHKMFFFQTHVTNVVIDTATNYLQGGKALPGSENTESLKCACCLRKQM